VYQVVLIFGSIGLFLYGMNTLSEGLRRAAGERLQSVLNFMTGSRFAAILTGILTTAIMQSSSTTTVMVVSFINAGLLELAQGIGVIMGANIGTTITGWIVALFGFNLSFSGISLPAIGVGFALIVIKRLKKAAVGEIFIGLGLLFLGLDFLKESVPDISQHQDLLISLHNFSGNGLLSYLFFILVGMLLTIIVQSSSASMAINLAMAYSGWYDFPTAAAIVLGGNVGTTVTAYLASFGTTVNARRSSRINIVFNVFGLLWMSLIFTPFLHFVDFLVPGDIFDPSQSHTIPFHLVTFHTLYNIGNVLIFSFFIPQLVAIGKKLVPDDDSLIGPYKLKYIRATMHDSPELYLLTVKRELFKMADITDEMFVRFWNTFTHPEIPVDEQLEIQSQQEDLTDQMQEEITTFLSKCSMDGMNKVSASNLHSMMRITNELESIGDNCYNLMFLAERRNNQELEIEEHAMNDLYPYVDLVLKFIALIRSNLTDQAKSHNLAQAQELENEINLMRHELKENASIRLQQGHEVRSELLYIDVLRHIEHIGDHCLNIVESLSSLSSR
jgi:phosphate:Na+ symporter